MLEKINRLYKIIILFFFGGAFAPLVILDIVGVPKYFFWYICISIIVLAGKWLLSIVLVRKEASYNSPISNSLPKYILLERINRDYDMVLIFFTGGFLVPFGLINREGIGEYFFWYICIFIVMGAGRLILGIVFLINKGYHTKKAKEAERLNEWMKKYGNRNPDDNL